MQRLYQLFQIVKILGMGVGKTALVNFYKILEIKRTLMPSVYFKFGSSTTMAQSISC